MNKFFENYKDATSYAKNIALMEKVAIKIIRIDNGFEVLQALKSIPTTKSSNVYNTSESEIDEVDQFTGNSSDENVIIKKITILLTHHEEFNETIDSTRIIYYNEIISKLKNTLSLLNEYQDLIDLGNPRSKQEAEQFAKNFNTIAIGLDPSKISQKIRTKQREMLELSKTKVSIDDDYQYYLQKVSILNEKGPDCRLCNHSTRMHIVGQRGSELWRCNMNNHGTRNLTAEQRNFLAS